MDASVARKHDVLAKLSSVRQKIADLFRLSENTKETALAALKLVLSTTRDVADACNLSPLKGSLIILLDLIDRCELSSDVKADLIAIVQKIEQMLAIFQRCIENEREQEMLDFMASLTSTIDAVRASIKSKLDRGSAKKLLSAPKDAKEIVRLLGVIGDSANVFVMNLNVNIATHVKQTLEQLKELKLHELPFIGAAQYQASLNTGCTPGTREGINGNLLSWSTAADQDEFPVCWLYGHAGVGKTTIMYTMSGVFERNGNLGGTFFCSRATAERRSITNIFPTIAQSLAVALPTEFRNALVAALGGRKGVGSFTPDQQFDILIAKPARDALENSESGWETKVVIIDALDECDDSGEATRMFLDILSRRAHGLHIRFLIASRPEPKIVHNHSGIDRVWSRTFYMQDIEEEIARDDVWKFLTSELSRCRNHWPRSTWPTEDRLKHLVSLSGSLFIYASTAWKYVSDLNAVGHSERLEEILTLEFAPSEEHIDSVYQLVLSGLWNRRRSKREQDVTRQCLQAIICLYEPLSIEDLSLLLKIKPSHVQAVLDSLQSVVRVPHSNINEPVTTFHASFANYLLDPDRSGGRPWHINETNAHRELCLRSWEVMKSQLHFNISGSGSSYLSNAEQIEHTQLPGALVYACLRWNDHLAKFEPSTADMALLQASFVDRFLYWLEVFSALNRVQDGQQILALLWQRMRKLLTDAYDLNQGAAKDLDLLRSPQITHHSVVNIPELHCRITEVERFTEEARRLIMAFAIPIATSAPHIYVSALACTQDGTMLRSVAGAHCDRLPSVVTKQARRVLPLLNFVGHDSQVISVVFSRDGKRIVSGSVDGTIRMWGPDTGTQLGEPLRGHDGSVLSVALSPNGKRIVSGSSDGTIRIWDAHAGAQLGEPLRGHNLPVYSIAFSHDGNRVASGSSDRTVRIWNPDTGIQVGEPLHGHSGWVKSVAFSPDGKLVVSGSHDNTIRLWDPETNTQVSEPLWGHDRCQISSVTFSPNGKRIVSGADDGTIRIWDPDTGTQVGESLRGHDALVKSVAFSPDGKRIVSGANDRTVRIWDPDTGIQIGDPLRGHSGQVNSVMFSPDGKRVVSGSHDHTIRTWDSDTCIEVGEQPRGHSGQVNSIMCSPDGQRVASGSHDHTIRIWDLNTGAQVGESLRGHSDRVSSVTFSPDGNRVASGSYDRTIRIWNSNTCLQVGKPLRGHDDAVLSLTFSPDGKRVMSGSHDCTIRIWNPNTGAQVSEPLHGHHGPVLSVAFAPDGQRAVSGSQDYTIRMWDLNTGTQVGEPLREHGASVRSVAFSPDGKRVVSGSGDYTIRLWDPDTGIQIGVPFRGHNGPVSSVMFSPDGKHVGSGSHDCTIRMWSAETGVQVCEPLHGHNGPVHSIAFLPDGRRIASASRDHTIRCWDVDTSSTAGEVVDSALAVRHLALSEDPAITISATPDHSLSSPSSLSDFNPIHNFGLENRPSFTLHIDGWVRGPNQELIFWVLPEYRTGLWWPGTTVIFGAHPVSLDLSGCTLGENWTRGHRCLDANTPNPHCK